MRGKIQAIYPGEHSSVYNYVCRGEGGMFSFPVEWRYHVEILKGEGYPVGREVEYNDEIDPPMMRFLD